MPILDPETQKNVDSILARMKALPGQGAYTNLPSAGSIASLLQSYTPDQIVAMRASQLAAAGNPLMADDFNHAGSGAIFQIAASAKLKGKTFEQEAQDFYSDDDPNAANSLPKTFIWPVIVARAELDRPVTFAGNYVAPPPAEIPTSAPDGVSLDVLVVYRRTKLTPGNPCSEDELVGIGPQKFLYWLTAGAAGKL